MVKIKLFATLRTGREDIYDVPGDQFSTAQEVVDFYNIEQKDVSIFLINGIHSKMDATIKDGDVIAIFPPVGGG